MSATCGDCSGERRITARPATSLRSGAVTVSVDPRSAATCDRGCDDAEDRLGSAVDRAVNAGLTFSRGAGVRSRCGSCDATLDLPMRATVRSVTVEPAETAPFTLTFGLPLGRCGGCGVDNVPSALADDVTRSARAACGVRTDVRPAARFRRLLRRGGRGSL